MPIKIIIADDHPILIKGLQNVLEHSANIQIINTYQNTKALLQGLVREQPDVLLLDIQMPDQAGDEIVAILRHNYPDMGILVLTHFEQEYYIKVMIQNGVLGYVLKSSDEQTLLDGIESVYSGKQYFDPAIRKRVLKSGSDIFRSPSLTVREKEILTLIALDYSSQAISEKLFISRRTVENHRANLLWKLDAKSTGSLIKKAFDLGLLK